MSIHIYQDCGDGATTRFPGIPLHWHPLPYIRRKMPLSGWELGPLRALPLLDLSAAQLLVGVSQGPEDIDLTPREKGAMRPPPVFQISFLPCRGRGRWEEVQIPSESLPPAPSLCQELTCAGSWLLPAQSLLCKVPCVVSPSSPTCCSHLHPQMACTINWGYFRVKKYRQYLSVTTKPPAQLGKLRPKGRTTRFRPKLTQNSSISTRPPASHPCLHLLCTPLPSSSYLELTWLVQPSTSMLYIFLPSLILSSKTSETKIKFCSFWPVAICAPLLSVFRKIHVL